MPIRKMRWTIRYGNRNYGPGEAVDVPEGLARSLDKAVGRDSRLGMTDETTREVGSKDAAELLAAASDPVPGSAPSLTPPPPPPPPSESGGLRGIEDKQTPPEEKGEGEGDFQAVGGRVAGRSESADEEEEPEVQPQPERKELVKRAEALGIVVKARDRKDQIQAKIDEAEAKLREEGV